ncbi:selenide, water dikinase SelD [Shimwellia pseudoproteus]|uniref:selenide, water dikinase SelD n=1 Tax=Shimwellia pseudoproteus TaxID=570012 RepID=UPI0018EDFB8A|nr:selenide, water dikinase SelD [Shimwellia pseudoproteus]MBJ3813945.1 selenide, water dikinase SelD [Shimwellia pseudoproteus]
MSEHSVTPDNVRLTQYSHGAGCGCKISPKVLEAILHSEQAKFVDPNLLVGNETSDDAAVYDLGNGTCIISTTDFFMPIVDDAFDFGRIAATNAISDIFAMGGKPIMAIAILGWPINVLSPEIARRVIEGGRFACQQAGIALAGGHSIDSPEPIFGLAVTGVVSSERIKKNSTAEAGCKLFLTKPLGIGVLTTAEKKSLLRPEHQGLATRVMCQMNLAGADFAAIDGVKAMTDVTGFGLLGHLSEVCRGAGVQALVRYQDVPKLPGVEEYIAQGSVPGGSGRNFASYGYLMGEMPQAWRDLLCDPQTSGGLLLAVTPDAEAAVQAAAAKYDITLTAIGELRDARAGRPMIEIV